MRRFIVPMCLFVLAITISTVASASDGDYRLVKEIKVGGEGGWDSFLFNA